MVYEFGWVWHFGYDGCDDFLRDFQGVYLIKCMLWPVRWVLCSSVLRRTKDTVTDPIFLYI